jgi:hypothetical protein
VNLIFSLCALAAQKMRQLHNHLPCHAAKKMAIHARRSETNRANSQILEKLRDVNVVLFASRLILSKDQVGNRTVCITCLGKAFVMP